MYPVLEECILKMQDTDLKNIPLTEAVRGLFMAYDKLPDNR